MAFRFRKHNRETASILADAVLNQNVPHAMIFECSDVAEMNDFAWDFAKALLCKQEPGNGCGVCPICRKIETDNHVDITVVKAEAAAGSHKKSIKTKDIEMLHSRLMMAPYDGNRNVAIIEGADYMSPQAANKFLKTLEEPPAGTVIMMLVENADALLPTVLSRAVRYRLDPAENEKDKKAAKNAKQLVQAIEDGEPYFVMRKMIEKIGKGAERTDVAGMLDQMEELYRESLPINGDFAGRQHVIEIIYAIETTRKDILGSVTITNALKSLVLNIGGK